MLNSMEGRDQRRQNASSFTTYASVGIPHVSDLHADASAAALVLQRGVSWDLQPTGRCILATQSMLTSPEGYTRNLQHKQLLFGRIRAESLLHSKRSRDQQRQRTEITNAFSSLWQLGSHPDHSSTGVKKPTAQAASDAPLPLVRQPNAGDNSGIVTTRDPNVVGFMPAFILGDVYVSNLPDR